LHPSSLVEGKLVSQLGVNSTSLVVVILASFGATWCFSIWLCWLGSNWLCSEQLSSLIIRPRWEQVGSGGSGFTGSGETGSLARVDSVLLEEVTLASVEAI